MFNRKISKKLTTSQREEPGRVVNDRTELELRKIHATVNQTHNPRYDLPEFHEEAQEGKKRSQSRIAAGFGSEPGTSSTRNGRRGQQNFSEDDFPTERSTNEIGEEFDVDDADAFRYPTSSALTGELLLEEYNELINESADDVRTTDESQLRILVGMSPQVSKVPFRTEVLREQSRSLGGDSLKNPSEKIARRNSRSMPPKSLRKEESPPGSPPRSSSRSPSRSLPLDSSRSPARNPSSRSSSRNPPRTSQEMEDDFEEDLLEEDPEAPGVRSYSRVNAEYSQKSSLNSLSRLQNRSNLKNSLRNSKILNSEPAPTNNVNNPDSSGPEARQTISYSSNNRLGSNVASLENSNFRSLQNSNLGSLQTSNIGPLQNSNNQNGNTGAFQNTNAGPRDVVPLPIEIPDTVTDADAFRRYLSVRRGAIFPSSQSDAERSTTIESLGANRGVNQYPAGPQRSASQVIPVSFVNSSASLSPVRPPPPDFNQNYPPPDVSPSNPGPPPPPPGCMSQADARGVGHKRTASLSHAIMTLALLSASAAQLRFVVAYSHAHAYPTLNYFLICSCIIIEVLVGIGFVVLARFDFSEDFQDKLHSYLIFGLFVITVANVIIAAFALDDHICEVLLKRSITEGTVVNPVVHQQPFQQPLFDDTQLNRGYNDLT